MDYYTYRPGYHPRYRIIIEYPKFLLLFLTFLFAYLIFQGKSYVPLHSFISSLDYFGTFVSGMMYAYGFTAAPATSLLLILSKEQILWFSGILGGFGSLMSDFIIFTFIRTSFKDEVNRLAHEKPILWIKNKLPALLKRYLVPFIAFAIIALPLPDEIGVTLLATYRKISMKSFAVLSFLLNTAGILIVLLIGKSI